MFNKKQQLSSEVRDSKPGVSVVDVVVVVVRLRRVNKCVRPKTSHKCKPQLLIHTISYYRALALCSPSALPRPVPFLNSRTKSS